MLLVLLLTITLYQYHQLLFSAKPCRWSEAPGCRCCSCWWRGGHGPGDSDFAPGLALLKPRLALRTSRHLGPRDLAPRRGGRQQEREAKRGAAAPALGNAAAVVRPRPEFPSDPPPPSPALTPWCDPASPPRLMVRPGVRCPKPSGRDARVSGLRPARPGESVRGSWLHGAARWK